MNDMGFFLVYIFKSALCLAVFYLFYRLLLSRETLHRFNRAALLGVLLLSAVVPLVEVGTGQPSGVGQTLLTLEEWLALAGPAEEASPAASVEESRALWPRMLLLVYGAGMLFFLACYACSLFRLWQLLRGTRREDIGRYLPGTEGVSLLVHGHEMPPFSWMRCIVISRRDLEEDGCPILLHELAHVRGRHSWDLLPADLCCLLQWFNPAAWLLKQELQTVHEYEADKAVLDAGVNAKEYQLLLIKKAVGTKLYSMANSLNHSKLRKRITMMMKERSSNWACVKYFYVLPLAAVAVASFARPEVSGVSNRLSDAGAGLVVSMEMEPSGVPQDTLKVERLHGKVAGAVYDVVDQMPQYPGGIQAMMQFVKDNLQYPEDAKEGGIQGRVVLQFVVDKTGQVTDPKVMRSVSPSLDAEAIRVVKAMPRWIPGSQDGEVVAVRYVLPVSFSLEKDSQSPVSSSSGEGNLPSQKQVLVIDGKIVSSEKAKALSPSDIAEIRVLKDGEAVEKYGEAVKGGAVEITTKAASGAN